MLFPTVDQHLVRIVIGLLIGLAVTAVVLVAIGFSQANQLVGLAPTATSTKTPTARATATPTASLTYTTTPTPTPTNTSTPMPTPTSTNTPSPTPLPPTFTPLPPTSTFTPIITETLVIPATESIEVAVTAPLTATLALSQTVSLTSTGVVTPIGTPTPMPTPVPRTILVPSDLPDYAAAESHFWFTRPFTGAYQTWGSYYYPYGTNARGQYFWHKGIDIQNPQGSPILAVGDGTVSYAGPDDVVPLGPWPDFYGQAVVIEHDRRWEELPVYTLYGHVSRVLVQAGQQVKAGDVIAEVGQLGVALGPHLHLEIRLGAGTYADARNPDLWVRPDQGFGVIAGRVIDYQNYFVPQQLVTLHRASSPGKFWRQTFTYPDGVVGSDDSYVETFSFSDVPAGAYLVKTFFDGRQLTVPITVTNLAITYVPLQQTEPPPHRQQPSPTPPAATPPPEGEQPPTTQP